MKKKILGLLALQMGLSAPLTSHALTAEELLGGIIGGVGGALLCNELSGGRNQGATAACAIGGAILGTAIGSQLSNDDREAYRGSYNRTLGRRVGERDEWRGNNHRGYTEVVRTGYSRREVSIQCREVRSVVTDNYGRVIATESETSCYRQERWVRVETTEVVYGGGGGYGGDNYGGGYGGGYGGNLDDRYDRDDRYDGRRPGYENRAMTNERFSSYLFRLDRARTDRERLQTIRQLTQDLRMNRMTLSIRQHDRALETFESRHARREARAELSLFLR